MSAGAVGKDRKAVCVRFVSGPGPISPPRDTYYGTSLYLHSARNYLRVRLVCSGWFRARPAYSRSSMNEVEGPCDMHVCMWMYVRCEIDGCSGVAGPVAVGGCAGWSVGAGGGGTAKQRVDSIYPVAEFSAERDLQGLSALLGPH